MKTVNAYCTDRLADWFKEHTGSRPERIQVERSHRGKDWTNVRIEMPIEFAARTNRKNLVLPIQDAILSSIEHREYTADILNFILGGAIKKAGLFHWSHAKPELDKYLY